MVAGRDKFVARSEQQPKKFSKAIYYVGFSLFSRVSYT